MDPTEKMIRFFTGKEPGERTKRKEKAIKFPVKLMYALQCGDYDNILCWTPNGLAFVILDPTAFERIVLPEIFKQAKFASFQRKLKRWGFLKTRINVGKIKSCYCQPNFVKGGFQQCMEMRCLSQTSTSASLDTSTEISTMVTGRIPAAAALSQQSIPVLATAMIGEGAVHGPYGNHNSRSYDPPIRIYNPLVNTLPQGDVIFQGDSISISQQRLIQENANEQQSSLRLLDNETSQLPFLFNCHLQQQRQLQRQQQHHRQQQQQNEAFSSAERLVLEQIASRRQQRSEEILINEFLQSYNPSLHRQFM